MSVQFGTDDNTSLKREGEPPINFPDRNKYQRFIRTCILITAGTIGIVALGALGTLALGTVGVVSLGALGITGLCILSGAALLSAAVFFAFSKPLSHSISATCVEVEHYFTKKDMPFTQELIYEAGQPVGIPLIGNNRAAAIIFQMFAQIQELKNALKIHEPKFIPLFQAYEDAQNKNSTVSKEIAEEMNALLGELAGGSNITDLNVALPIILEKIKYKGAEQILVHERDPKFPDEPLRSDPLPVYRSLKACQSIHSPDYFAPPDRPVRSSSGRTKQDKIVGKRVLTSSSANLLLIGHPSWVSSKPLSIITLQANSFDDKNDGKSTTYNCDFFAWTDDTSKKPDQVCACKINEQWFLIDGEKVKPLTDPKAEEYLLQATIKHYVPQKT